MSLSAFAVALVACVLSASGQSGAQQAQSELPQLTGRLDRQFLPSSPRDLTFTRQTGESRAPVKALGEWIGTIPLPRLVSLKAGGTLAVIAITTAPDITTFYADLNLNAQITDEELVVFRRSDDPRYESYSILKVQLPGPPARVFGVAVFLPRGGGTTPAPTLAYDMGAQIHGSFRIQDREIGVRLPFDLVKEAVDLDGYVGMDANGDGHIDDRQVSTEYAYTPHGVPVFHVGNHLVSFAAADYPTRRFTLREHPAADDRWNDLSIGQTIPDFTFRTFDNRTHRLTDFRGRFVLIVYWSRLCGFAQQEIPFVNAAYAAFKDLGFEVIGLLDEDDPANLADFFREKGISWLNALPESTRELTRTRLRFYATPTCLLIDPEGRVVSRGQDGEPPIRGAELKATLIRSLKTIRDSTTYSPSSQMTDAK